MLIFDWILRTDISVLQGSAIKSGGFVIDTLEAVLWCFLTTDTDHDTVLKAVNLGGGVWAIGVDYALAEAVPDGIGKWGCWRGYARRRLSLAGGGVWAAGVGHTLGQH